MNRCQSLINQQEEGVSFVGESWPQKKGPKCQTFCLEVMLEKTFQSFYMLMKHQFFYWLWHTTVDLYWKLVMWLWQQLNVKAYRQIESWAKVTHKLLKKIQQNTAERRLQTVWRLLIKSWRNNKSWEWELFLWERKVFLENRFFGLRNMGKVCSSCADHSVPFGKIQNSLFFSQGWQTLFHFSI